MRECSAVREKVARPGRENSAARERSAARREKCGQEREKRGQERKAREREKSSSAAREGGRSGDLRRLPPEHPSNIREQEILEYSRVSTRVPSWSQCTSFPEPSGGPELLSKCHAQDHGVRSDGTRPKKRKAANVREPVVLEHSTGSRSHKEVAVAMAAHPSLFESVWTLVLPPLRLRLCAATTDSPCRL